MEASATTPSGRPRPNEVGVYTRRRQLAITWSDAHESAYDWELLRESLEHMLATGEPRMHEPAYQPREDDYVVWDYGKGYVDALTDAGLEEGSSVSVTSCPWCETPVEPHFAFCSRCGRPLAVVRLFRELKERGIDEREARALLLRAGFEPFS